MGTAWRSANEALAFLLELAALAALGYWGFRVGPNLPARIVLGVGAVALAVVVWGLFAAPRARFKLPVVGVLAVKVLVFGSATAALYAAGRHVLAIVFATAAAVNTVVVTFVRNAHR
jgi:hypothetical protein